MGVKSCIRNSCEHIMCDTYINDVGYLCNTCKHEFKLFLKSKNVDTDYLLSEYEFIIYLKEFVKTDAGSFDNSNRMSVDDHFKEYEK